MLGAKVHGYNNYEDLSCGAVKTMASQGWLENKQYLAILLNVNYFGDLRKDPSNDILEAALANPPEGNICLCPETWDDTIMWRLEEFESVEIHGIFFFNLKTSYSEVVEKREYHMISPSTLKLCHYLPIQEEKQREVMYIVSLDAAEEELDQYNRRTKDQQGEMKRILGQSSSTGKGP